MADKLRIYDSLKFLEKSHCISIITALYRNGMMNRNQLYNELGETINIMIKRIDLLIERELVYEIKMKAKPFTKGLVLTGKGTAVAEKLREIEFVMNQQGTGDIARVNYPFAQDEDLWNEVWENRMSGEYYRKYIKSLRCPRCGNEDYLMKDKEDFVWVCFVCGNKRKANIKEAQRLKLAESFGGIGFDMDPTQTRIEPEPKPITHEVKDSFGTKKRKRKKPADTSLIDRLFESGQVTKLE